MELNQEFFDDVKQCIAQKESEKLKEMLMDLHPADIAELCNDLSLDDARYIYRLLDNEERRHRTGIKSWFKNIWLGIDAFNILGIDNVNSYYWVKDVSNNNYAVPNYLTGRRINGRILIEF